MPRRSSGGGFSTGRSSPRTSSKTAARSPQKAPAPPAPKGASAPAPAPASDSGKVLGEAIADGFGWGFGTSVAHRVSDFIWGPRVVRHETVESQAPAAIAQSNSMDRPAGSDACYASTKSFKDCLNKNTSDIGKCQFYMDMITECRKNTGSVDSIAI